MHVHISMSRCHGNQNVYTCMSLHTAVACNTAEHYLHDTNTVHMHTRTHYPTSLRGGGVSLCDIPGDAHVGVTVRVGCPQGELIAVLWQAGLHPPHAGCTLRGGARRGSHTHYTLPHLWRPHMSCPHTQTSPLTTSTAHGTH